MNWTQQQILDAAHAPTPDALRAIAADIGDEAFKALIEEKNLLHWAVRAGSVENVDFLVEKGANLKAGSRGTFTPLHIAAEEGNLTLVEFLLSKGAKADADHALTAAIHGIWTAKTNPDAIKAQQHNAAAIVKLLLDAGATVDDTDIRLYTPLHAAAEEGNIAALTLLLAKNPDIEAQGLRYKTPLHCAAMNGHTEAALLLLARGAASELVDYNGQTPAETAQEYGHPSTAEKIAEYVKAHPKPAIIRQAKTTLSGADHDQIRYTNNAANELMKRSKPHRAAILLEQTRASYPQEATLQYTLARAYYLSNRHQEAEQAAIHALPQLANSWDKRDCYKLLGDIHRKQGNHKAAWEFYDQAGSLDTNLKEKLDHKRRKQELLGSTPAFVGIPRTVPQILASRTFSENPHNGLAVYALYDKLFQHPTLGTILTVAAMRTLMHPKSNITITDGAKVGDSHDEKHTLGTYNRKNSVAVAYEGTLTPEAVSLSYDNLDFQGTLIHELSHRLMQDLFANGGEPWPNGETEMREEFSQRCNEVLARIAECIGFPVPDGTLFRDTSEKMEQHFLKKEDTFTPAEVTVMTNIFSVYKLYSSENLSREMIVRFPELTASANDPKALSLLEPLQNYWEKHITPAIHNYIEKHSAYLPEIAAEPLPTAASPAAKATTQGITLLTSGNYEDAALHLEEAHALEPDNTLFQENLYAAYGYCTRIEPVTREQQIKTLDYLKKNVKLRESLLGKTPPEQEGTTSWALKEAARETKAALNRDVASRAF